MKGSLRQGPTFHTISFGLRFHNEETKVCTNERAVTREGQRQHGLSERAAVDGAYSLCCVTLKTEGGRCQQRQQQERQQQRQHDSHDDQRQDHDNDDDNGCRELMPASTPMRFRGEARSISGKRDRANNLLKDHIKVEQVG